MVDLSNVLSIDPTLEAADAAYQERENANEPRSYLGMSGIGHECLRKGWYDFRWASASSFDAETLYRFDDGHRSEDIMADRLRLVADIKLETVDQYTGEQFGFKDLGGHFSGHADGKIAGLLQAPKTQHIWEHKATNEKKQAKLEKLKRELGEKAALAAWDEIYYVQAQLYMHYSGLKRHYLTCASPGTRTTISVRTNYDKSVAEQQISNARTIIAAAIPPAKLSDDPSFYKCGWCNHKGICHYSHIPQPSCRTCIHSTPEPDGDGRWTCAEFGCDIDKETMLKSMNPERPCPHHRFIPQLIAGFDVMDAGPDGVLYENHDGLTVINGSAGLSSMEMYHVGASKRLAEATGIKKPSADSGPASWQVTSEPDNPHKEDLLSVPTVDTSNEIGSATAAVSAPAWQTAVGNAKASPTGK